MPATVTAEVRDRPDLQRPLEWLVGIFGLPNVLGEGVKWIVGFATKAEANAWLSAQTFKSITQVDNGPKEDPRIVIGIDGLGATGGVKWLMRFATTQLANQYINNLRWGGMVLAP